MSKMNLEYTIERDYNQLINLRPLVIYIFLNEHEYSFIGDEIRRMNNYVDFTRNLFRIEPVYRTEEKPNLEGDRHLIRSISYRNLWMRLIGVDNEHYYIFGYLNTSPSFIREELYKYISLFCRVNISHIESRLRNARKENDNELITKLQLLLYRFEEARDQKRTPGLARWKSSLEHWEFERGCPSSTQSSAFKKVRSQNMELHCVAENIGVARKAVEIFNRVAPISEVPSTRVRKIKRTILSFDESERQELWKYMRSLCGDFPDEQESKSAIEGIVNTKPAQASRKTSPNPTVQIEIKKIKNLKSGRSKYGVEIVVDDHRYPIYIGPVNERMAYIATLLRHKTNNYLYHHEFNNTLVYKSKRKFTQRTSYKWLESLYEVVEPSRKVNFSVWISKFKNDKGRAIHQAMSNIRRAISDTMKEDTYAAIPYVSPTTSHDALGDGFYMVKIDADNIIVPKELQDLVDNFNSYYA